jgi:hypothetical protein
LPWLWYSVGDGTVRNNRMSPVGVQIEIGAIHDNTVIQHLLLSIVLSLNVESGSTLFRIILFAFSLRNKCDVIHRWERITLN